MERQTRAVRPRLIYWFCMRGCFGRVFGLGLQFGSFRNADSPMAVAVGMLAVTAMATQKYHGRASHWSNTPSTAVMTTNTTQLLIDLVAIVQDSGIPLPSSKPGSEPA